MKTAGTPTGTATPTPSRSRPMSSMATHHVCPANDTVSARLAARSPSSQPPTSSAVHRSAISCLGQRAQHSQQVGDALGVAGRAVLS